MKQKGLLSSLREKKRYLVFEIKTDNNFSFSDVSKAILKSFKELFGEIGLSKAGLNFVEYKNNKGIVKVNNKYVKNLQASMCFLRKINKQDLIVRSLGVSGILKRARIKFLGGAL